ISPIDFVVTNANPNVTAVFFVLPPNTFALTTLINGDGTVAKSPQQSNYVNGASVLVTAIPSGGYFFTGWSGNAAGTNNPLNVTMDASKIITANFGTNAPPPDVPPTVSITNPIAGSVFVAPANIPVHVSAADSNVVVTSVTFYAGTNLLGTV